MNSKKLQSIFTLTLVTVLLTQLVIPMNVLASSVDVTASNTRTQGGSTNNAEARVALRVSVINENDADISNDFIQDANTGNNIIEDINGDVDATTGDITQDTTATVTANHNHTEIGDSLDGVVTAENDTTQSDSTNLAESVLSMNVDVLNSNNADISNSLDSFANSGLNAILDVNGDAKLRTGDIEYSDDFENVDVNMNNTYIGFDTNDIVVSTRNDKTQSDSVNKALAYVDVNYVEVNEQDLNIDNSIVRTNNTGGNECVEINGDCELETGSIKGTTGVTNTGNNNNNGIGVPLPEDPKDEDPVGNGDIDEGVRDDKSFIDKIIETIIPSASAEESEEQDDTVLGAMELPATGVGEIPHVGWTDVLFGLGIVAIGFLLRKRYLTSESVDLQS